MTARYATPEEIDNWDSLILKNPDGGNVFSSLEYAEIKKLTAYTPLFIVVGNVAVTVLEKNTLPFGKLWYLPKGPGVDSAKELFSCLEALKPLAKKANAFVIRVETELPSSTAPTRRKRHKPSGVGKPAATPPALHQPMRLRRSRRFAD